MKPLAIVAIVFGVSIGLVGTYWFLSVEDSAPDDAATIERLYEDVTWLMLVPSDWQPQEQLQRKLEQAAALDDEDERAQEMMKELREVLDAAPTVDSLDGRFVRLPGYVVPLEGGHDGLSEFLLVPYFGACIHTPPPPANQIVHVTSSSPVKGFQSMSAVWVRGVMSVQRSDSDMGVSGYALNLVAMDPYQE